MSNKSPQDPLLSLCLAAWDCVRMCVCVNASFPSFYSLFSSSLSVCLLDRHALLFLSTKAFIGPSQPFPSGGLCAEESPSEWAFIWSCASGRRGLIWKGPSVDLLSNTERGRADGYLSFSERLAQRGPSRPTKTAGLYRSLPLLFIHFRSQSVSFHRSRSSVSCLVFLVACCSHTGRWFNLRISVRVQASLLHTSLAGGVSDAAEGCGLQGCVRGGEWIKAPFSIMSFSFQLSWAMPAHCISHKQLKVIWTLECIRFFLEYSRGEYFSLGRL